MTNLKGRFGKISCIFGGTTLRPKIVLAEPKMQFYNSAPKRQPTGMPIARANYWGLVRSLYICLEFKEFSAVRRMFLPKKFKFPFWQKLCFPIIIKVKTSTKFVHRCVSLIKVNKGKQSQGLLKSMNSLKTFESWGKI